MDKIAQALARLFDKHRIVFWYDEKQELRGEYESLWLPGVEKIDLVNNEFEVKYHILREKPNQKFLLYHEGPQPKDLENWLLDVQLASGLFNANQEALWANEVGLQPHLFDLVIDHPEFFKDEKRRIALKSYLTSEDTHDGLRIKMLSLCVGADVESRLEGALESLLAELAQGRHDRFDLVQRCRLDLFLWERLKKHFGYQSATLSVKDFAITLFQSCYASSLEESSALNQDALVFLKRWRDNVRHQKEFAKLSEESSNILGIEKDLEKRDLRKLIDMDFFRLIDQKILSELAQQIYNQTISAGDCANLIWRRRTTHWYSQYGDIYQALYFASQFMHELGNAELRMDSLSDGIRKYQATWYRIDQYYRKYIFHSRSSRMPLLDKLTERVENIYSNNFLLTVNDHWQRLVDAAEIWSAAPVPSQAEFFERQIRSYLGTKNKVAVIISDALRYEIGEELARDIQEEDRFTAEIEPMLASLPSYTQLGMAALLPHTKISLAKDGTAQVDGQSATGTENRSRILKSVVKGDAAAIRSSDLLNMSKEESRDFTRENQIIYVYHDQIDAIGDDKKTEERVFNVTQSAIGEIIEILKKITNANLSNVIITADHGFIYQNQALDESEFAVEDVQGGEIFIRSRRFVLGVGLKASKSLKGFEASQVGLTGEYEIMIPKSINRLRQQGAGSRYVHGGAALQEVVIPLIKVNKKRSSDIHFVNVDVINAASMITSGQMSVAFYQTEPVSGKASSRVLRAGIFAKDGTLLSEIHTLNFDLTSENPREREVKKQFILSRKADDLNNQTVYLRLEEPEPDTSHFKLYKEISYQLRRSFTTDFDM